jgi:uncharacterized membrane protein
MQNDNKEKFVIKRLGGNLHKVISVADHTGEIVHHVISPLMVELKLHDIMQILVGAATLAVPMAFTEEVWKFGEHLPVINVLLLSFLSLVFIALFVHFNFYREHLKGNVVEYFKRVMAIYLLSLVVVVIVLTIIEKCPWGTNNILAIKRVIIVAFPALMISALSDSIK